MKPIPDHDQVRRCVAEIETLLPTLPRRYSSLILIAALIEQVGGTLFVFQKTRICSPETARTIVNRVKQLAFAP
jgi:hypothetical protein